VIVRIDFNEKPQQKMIRFDVEHAKNISKPSSESRKIFFSPWERFFSRGDFCMKI
jgi:hypothetical protein